MADWWRRGLEAVAAVEADLRGDTELSSMLMADAGSIDGYTLEEQLTQESERVTAMEGVARLLARRHADPFAVLAEIREYLVAGEQGREVRYPPA